MPAVLHDVQGKEEEAEEEAICQEPNIIQPSPTL